MINDILDFSKLEAGKVVLEPTDFDPRELVDLSAREVAVEVNLRNGTHDATIWTNDLTYDYVRENAEYST